MPMNRVRVLIVGYGLMGKRRAAAIRTLSATLPVSVAGVHDSSLPGGTLSIDGYPVWSKADVLNRRDEYDAAFICVPHDATNAALAGISNHMPILVEKPCGNTLSIVEAIHADQTLGCAGEDRTSFAGYNYRFLPHVSKALDIVRSEQLGRLRSVDIRLGHGGSPEMRGSWKVNGKKSGGVVVDLGSHCFDLMRMVVGANGLSNPLRVANAQIASGFWDKDFDEDAAISLYLFPLAEPEPFIGTIRVSMVRWLNEFRMEIHGEDSYAILTGRGGFYGTMILEIGKRWAWHSSGLNQVATEEIPVFQRDDTSVEDETESVLKHWLGKSDSIAATLSDAVAVMRLCEEAKRKANNDSTQRTLAHSTRV